MPAAHQPRASQKPSRSIVSTVIRALSRLRPVRRQRLPLRPQRFHLHSGSNSSELLTVTPSAMRTTASSFVPNFYLSVCSSCAEAFEDLPGTSVPFAIHAPPFLLLQTVFYPRHLVVSQRRLKGISFCPCCIRYSTRRRPKLGPASISHEQFRSAVQTSCPMLILEPISPCLWYPFFVAQLWSVCTRCLLLQ